MLNDTKIKGLKSKEKRYKISDGDNLYIQVMPSGTKTFIYEFKSKESGKYKRISLGSYPAVSLLKAREKRLEFQKMLVSGLEPQSQNGKSIMTFKDVFEEWYEYKRKEVSAKQAFTHMRYYERFFIPKFGNRDVKSITRRDIIEATDELNKEGKFETLGRALASITSLFKWALVKDYLEHNVALDIEKKALFKKPKVTHYAAILDENGIRNLIKNIQGYYGDVRVITSALFGLLTAQRPFNARAVKWSEIDLENKMWIIPGNSMKMKEPHSVPLSNQAVKLLKDFKKFEFKSEYIFPSVKTTAQPISDNSVRSMLRNLGYSNEEITPHGFRAMFSTICHEHIAEHGLNERIIELCLDHTERNKIKAAYNHAKNLKERAALMQWWADYLSRLCPDI